MRQTKRRRTRDVACQTLSFRELRDVHSNSSSIGECSVQKYKDVDHDGDCSHRHRHQHHQQQQPHHLLRSAKPTTRSMSKREPTTTHITSVSAVPTEWKERNAINHGSGGKLGVRRGCKGEVKQKYVPQDARSGTTSTIPVGLDGMGAPRSIHEDNHKGGPRSDPKQLSGLHHQHHDDFTSRRQPQPPGSANPTGLNVCRPQPFQLRTSSPLGYVSVSWGDELQGNGCRQAHNPGTDAKLSQNGGQTRNGTIFTSIEHPSVDLRDSIGGGGGGGGGGLEMAGRRPWLDRICNTTESACGGSVGGYAYEPLSKDSDYRKVNTVARGQR